MGFKALEECWSEFKVEEDSLNQAVMGKIPETDIMKKQVLCVAKVMGVMNGEGKFLLDKSREKTGIDFIDKMNEVVVKCAVDKGTPEDTAFSFVKCIKQSLY